MFAVSAGLGFPRKVIKSSEGGGGGVKSEELLKWMSRDGISFWIISLSLGLILSKSAGEGKLRHLPDKVKVYDYKICKAAAAGG